VAVCKQSISMCSKDREGESELAGSSKEVSQAMGPALLEAYHLAPSDP
jgi:hypothetical protein